MSDERLELEALLGEMRSVGPQLLQLNSPYPLEAPTFGPPASLDDVKALEDAAAVSLPADYRAFLLRCGWMSAMDMFNGYALLEPPVVVGIMLEQVEVPRRVLRYPSPVPILPVAADGGGDLFLLAAEPPFTVWKWNHEIGAAEDGALPEDSPALTPIGGTFTDFLRRVVEDWRHFVSDDREWPYISG
jgi:hypothetical protein